MSRQVVITGGAKGIGREIALRFAALGDRVLAVGRDEAALGELAAATDGAVQTAVCDVTEEASVTELFAGLGAVDTLVNNAGTAESAPLHRTSLESWERHLAVNATGPFLCIRAVIDDMRRRGDGAIVTVASTAARVGAPYTAAYAASKHAALGVTRVAAAELAGTGARANAVCPAFVDTKMTARSIERIARTTSRTPEESAAALAQSSPLGRLLDPGEVAAAVVWLASPEAASINGQTVILDGGGIQA
jgi:NAD(P)-dependent dehydrogenase (short-subunit alcohol dehydrogenase family)